MMHRLFACLLVLGACASSASAQSVIYGENFDGGPAGTLPAGWSADAPTGTVGWSVDATPAVDGVTSGMHTFSGGCYASIPSTPMPPPMFGTAPFTLNFNNGVNTESGGLYSGGATSPVVTVSSLTGVTLTFWCRHEGLTCDVSPSAAGFGSDQKFVEILDSTGSTVLLSVQICVDADGDGAAPYTSSSPLINTCYEMFSAHTHTLDISGIAVTSFRIRFRANEVVESTLAATLGPDTLWMGWFVDSVSVNCPTADLAAPTIPTQIAPASGITVVSPVVFDWSDSTDTAPCGPGTVVYRLQIDNLGTVGFPDFDILGIGASTAAQALAPGSYEWRVLATDGSGNSSAFTGLSPFDVEVNLPPDLADTLFVNESINGAQNGEPGFVDPVTDQEPVFSAIYRDANAAPDFAAGLRYQVSLDPTFATFVFDSGLVGLSPVLPDDTRCPDLTINVTLSRDTVYFWRIQFTDVGGITGAFSPAQSFRIGDDFEFGVRKGSSHHGRRCWVATAAWGSESSRVVTELQAWRSSALEAVPVGRMASRAYHVGGAVAAEGMSKLGIVEVFKSPLTGSLASIAIIGMLFILAIGASRFSVRS